MSAQINMTDEITVDGFCGGGGWSTGFELAIGRPVDIGINHDADAIAMHKRNHSFTKHYNENIFEVDPYEATQGRDVGWAHFSPDCTHFSRAKGGTPVKKSIRGLAWVVTKWAGTVRPRIISMENVPEFMTWGPLCARRDKSGRVYKTDGTLAERGEYVPYSKQQLVPDKRKTGQTFKRFITVMRSLGYECEWKILTASDYGAPTIRKRLFILFRSDGKPIEFPKPTHGDPNSAAVKSGKLKPWHTAAECIDWTIPCPSIFERKKPLAENTLKRIAKGIRKFVIDNPEPFIVPIGYGERKTQTPRTHDIRKPLPSIVSTGKHYLVSPTLIQYHSEQSEREARGQALGQPLQTVDTANRYGLVSAFISKYFSGGHFAKVQAFLVKYCRTGTAESANEPLDTITTKDRFGLVTVQGEQYAIVDIGMRMLTPRELYNAQGFPPDYEIETDCYGRAYPKTKQVARCGNSVPPPFATAIVRANAPEWCGREIRTMKEFNRMIAV